MEKIKGKRVRVAAGKRKTRTATVHFRTETSVTPEQRRERLQAVFAALLLFLPMMGALLGGFMNEIAARIAGM